MSDNLKSKDINNCYYQLLSFTLKNLCKHIYKSKVK